MKKILTTVLISVTWLYCNTVYSQDLPKVIPPSPETAALFRFQDYPLDYSTGLPQISIPIYTINSGSLSLPISINYHSSGRKVNDETGAIGLGWTLMAGGMISRTIYGYPDDERWQFPSPWRTASQLSNKTDFLFLAAVGHHPFYSFPYYETQYDVFSYSANNLSGKFVLKDENNVKTAVLIPEKPHKIEWHKYVAQYVIEYFDYLNIVDDKGVLYRFGKSLRDGSGYLEKSSAGVTGWLLTEIVSANKADTISIKYKTIVGERFSVSQQTAITEYRYMGMVQDMGFDVLESESSNRSYYSMQRITEIKFKQGTVKFNLDANDCITSIDVKNKKNENIKSIQIVRSQLNTMTDGIRPVQKMDQLVFKDTYGNPSEQYSFQYHPSPTIDVRACDMWGYYNGASNPIGVINMRPFTIGYPPLIGGAVTAPVEFDFDLRPASLAMLSGVLEKIVLPTGGTTTFTYELNKFLHPQTQTVKAGAGLRIADIETDDGEGNILRKTYRYGENENGYGFLNIVPSSDNIQDYTRYQNFEEGAGGPVSHGSYSIRTVSSDILPVFNYVSQKPIIYTYVTEYHGSGSDNIGKTLYKYDFDDHIAPQSVESLFNFQKYRFWKTSELREKTVYKSVGSGIGITFEPQKKIKYNYTEMETDLIYGLHYKKQYVCTAPNEPVSYIDFATGQTKTTGIDQMVAEQWSEGGSSGPFGIHDWKIYKFGDYAISVGYKELTSVEEIDYLQGNEVSTLTSYTYNDRRLLSQTAKTVSPTETRITQTKYPFDFPSDPVCQEMVSRNMVNFEVEVNMLTNTTPLNTVKTVYKNWGNDLILPEAISTRTGSNAFEERIQFHSYDINGNIESVSKDNGPRITYLYGYDGQLPVCQATNALPNEIFYRDFEDNEGNSGENDARTGRRSRIGGYTKSLSGLTNGTYILSYWSKNSGQWQPVQLDNISVTSGSYNINITGQLDELRFYPARATLNSYTYDPLEGLLSSTDQNSASTYYMWDGYQRLIDVKDLNLHTLQHFDYHYKE